MSSLTDHLEIMGTPARPRAEIRSSGHLGGTVLALEDGRPLRCTAIHWRSKWHRPTVDLTLGAFAEGSAAVTITGVAINAELRPEMIFAVCRDQPGGQQRQVVLETYPVRLLSDGELSTAVYDAAGRLGWNVTSVEWRIDAPTGHFAVCTVNFDAVGWTPTGYDPARHFTLAERLPAVPDVVVNDPALVEREFEEPISANSPTS